MRNYIILLGAVAIIGFAAGAAQANDRHNLIVNRHTHSGDYTHTLKTKVGDANLRLPIKQQVFLRATLKQCQQSAQAQLDAIDGYLIESWRCEKVSQ